MGASPLLEEIQGAIASRSASGRGETLRKVTDLFVGGADNFNEQQVALFDDVIGSLAESTDTTAKAELSGRLATIANAPIKTLDRLAADDAIEVARPVLTNSSRLSDTHLAELAATKGRGHMMAIAGRRRIGEGVTNALLRRGDRDVMKTVATNAGAQLSEAGYDTLAEHAAGDPRLAECVVQRPDIPQRHFRTLIAIAPEAVQRRLASTNPSLAERIRQVIAEAEQKAAEAAHHDYGNAQRVVGALARAKTLADDQVGEFAKAGQFEESVVSLAELGGLSLEAAERLMTSEPTNTLLIVARAVSLTWPTAKALLLLRVAGHNAPQDIEDAKTSFIRLNPETAKQGLKFYKARAGHA